VSKQRTTHALKAVTTVASAICNIINAYNHILFGAYADVTIMQDYYRVVECTQPNAFTVRAIVDGL
jgi:hypothetical protein